MIIMSIIIMIIIIMVKQWFYGRWASEILHQLKTVVNIPLFRLGFNHPFGEAGFRNYPQYDDG